jgi:hypothetical protein
MPCPATLGLTLEAILDAKQEPGLLLIIGQKAAWPRPKPADALALNKIIDRVGDGTGDQPAERGEHFPERPHGFARRQNPAPPGVWSSVLQHHSADRWPEAPGLEWPRSDWCHAGHAST